MSKQKYKINDPDVRFGAGLYKLLIYIMGAAISIAMVGNTFSIGKIGYNVYQKWNDEKALSEYAVELNTEDEIISEFHYEETNEEYLESIENTPAKTLAITTFAKVIIFEVFLILIFIYYLNLYNFLENKNLSNPFNEDSVRFLSNTITYGIWVFALSVLFLGNIATITFEGLCVLVLIRYIIRKGIEYVNKK